MYSFVGGILGLLRMSNPGVIVGLVDALMVGRPWGYPSTPLLFILFSVYLVATSLMEAPRETLVGTLMILSGVPVFYYWKAETSFILFMMVFLFIV